MISPFRNLSLSHKLLSVIMVTCSGALLLACAVIMLYDLLLYREDMSQQLSVQADIIGANSTIALAQHDQDAARQTLRALHYQPSITKATMYAKDGSTFATYYSTLSSPAPSLSSIETLGFDFLTLDLIREIMQDGERVGTIYIQANLDQVLQRWLAFGMIAGGIIFASSLFAFLLSNRLQALISGPILRLTTLAQRVSSEKNYSLRETKDSQDEIGTLIDGVNDMLEQIQIRDRQLSTHQEKLEQQVAHRTAELEGLHRQVELILETAGEGIIGLDHQGHTTFINAAASHMLGWAPEELRGQCLHNFIHHTKLDGSPFPITECPLHRATEEGTNLSGTHDVFWRKDGTSFPVAYMMAPIRNEKGLVTGAVITFRDVTEQKQFEATLFDAIESAEIANQTKSRFLANMSHEIRTPMNGILGMSELLLHTSQTSKQRQFTESLHRSGQHLLRIINDILDFSKIEAKKLELEIVEFPLHQTIEDTVQLFAEPAQKKGLELICHIESSVPNCVQGDPGRIRQILTNLIGNAIKFTSQGEVYIRTSLTQEMHDTLELHVEVKDTGIGIPAEAQSRIFKAFSQADGSTTRKFGGTGLGLTITKELVELMGGKLSVVSEEGTGSTFMFTASLRKSEQSPLSPQEGCLLQGLRILLVEDNLRNQLALQEITNMWGVDIQLAHDGTQALRLLNQHISSTRQFDAVFIDQTLPDMEGIELAERIRENSTLSSLPLALMTPWHMTEKQEQRAAFAGLQQHILKPVRPSDLYDQLRALKDTPQSIPTSSSPAPSSPVQHHVGSASVLLAEDHQVNQEIVKAMAEHLGIHLEVVNNGVEAIRALARHSYDLVLMDWQMPEMDGLEATREIRKRESSQESREELGVRRTKQEESHRNAPDSSLLTSYRIPIIAITAHTSTEDQETCLNAGTDDILAKPFTLDQLQAKLGQWLPSSPGTEKFAPKGQEALPSQPSSLTDANTPGDILNPSALNQIRALQRPNVPSIVAKVLTQYFSHTPKLLADLQEGLQQEDWSLLHHAAHSLKSSSANVGAIHVSEHCKILEQAVRSPQNTDDLKSLVQKITADYETVKPLLVTLCNNEETP